MISHAADGEAAERGPLTNGRVDLVFRDGDELVVVDYKTDKDVTKDTAEAVRARAPRRPGRGLHTGLATATGLKVREVAFVYCKAGRRGAAQRRERDPLM